MSKNEIMNFCKVKIDIDVNSCVCIEWGLEVEVILQKSDVSAFNVNLHVLQSSSCT